MQRTAASFCWQGLQVQLDYPVNAAFILTAPFVLPLLSAVTTSHWQEPFSHKNAEQGCFLLFLMPGKHLPVSLGL